MNTVKRTPVQSQCLEAGQRNAGSRIPLPKRLEGCEVIYVRSCSKRQFQKCYALEGWLLSELEYSRFCKTTVGRYYVDLFGYRPYSRERVLELINS